MSKKEVKFTKKPGTPPASAEAWVNSSRGTDAAATVDTSSLPDVPMKRLTIDIPENLHARVKSQCAQRRTKMADEIRILLEKHFPAES